MKVFYDGKLFDEKKVSVPILAHSLHYGDAAFEGIRAYKLANGKLGIFRLEEHAERLRRSVKILAAKEAWSKEEIKRAIVETVRANKEEGDLYIRPLFFVGAGTLGLANIEKCPFHRAVMTIKFPPLLGEKASKVMISGWRKISSESYPVMAKLASNYVNSIIATREAKAAGYDEALFLNVNGRVAEGSGENIFIVKGKQLITPPPSEDILEGITRNTVMELAKELGLDVIERPVGAGELFFADELFFTGTAAEVVGIGEVNGITIGNGDVGEITAKLKEKYKAVVKGEDPKHKNWITEVD